jgi:hypothetical protein
MEEFVHGGYTVAPHVWRRSDGQYTAGGVVIRRMGSRSQVQPFDLPGEFASRDQAEDAAAAHARAIIDGRVGRLQI